MTEPHIEPASPLEKMSDGETLILIEQEKQLKSQDALRDFKIVFIFDSWNWLFGRVVPQFTMNCKSPPRNSYLNTTLSFKEAKPIILKLFSH